MPIFGLIARILARLALIGAVGAIRRRAGTAPPPWRTPPTGPPGPAPQPPPPVAPGIDPRSAQRVLRLLGEGVSIGVRVVLVAGFLAAFALLLTAGTTATTLGPRWLGACLLALAAIALVLALAELRVAWRLRMVQVRRKRAERLAERGL